jgi:hypothetical protein
MARSIALTGATLLALAVTALSPSQATAADRYAVISVENATRNATVGLSYRWGDGSWSRVRLRPGYRQHFCWRFSRPNENRNPPFHIRFDADVRPGHYTERYHLGAYRSPDCGFQYGHRYVFRYEVANRYVELYDSGR